MKAQNKYMLNIILSVYTHLIWKLDLIKMYK